MINVQKVLSPLSRIFGGRDSDIHKNSPAISARNVEVDSYFPEGWNVYGMTDGPSARSTEVMIGASNPETALGALFIGDGSKEWVKIPLPDETAFVNRWVRFADGRYLAGGMSSIGRAAILSGRADAREWRSVEHDLHSYSSIQDIYGFEDGTVIAAAGKMITQGKTKPVLLRSRDQGMNWDMEPLNLPISSLYKFCRFRDGRIFAGSAGDYDPLVFVSKDHGMTWSALPTLPPYKTYRMITMQEIQTKEGPRLYVVLWGYKTELADRIVRVYRSDPDFRSWEELPPVQDSHFLFSFDVRDDGTFIVGSEKGKIYTSSDQGITWNEFTSFKSNIGAYALFQDRSRRLWIGKDYVPPHEKALWRALPGTC